jgi:hypothetical protein
MQRQRQSSSVSRIVGAPLLLAAVAIVAAPAAAHHSLAMYDLEQSINFSGVIETLELQNPHSALTLTVSKSDGTKGTVSFVEAPGAARFGHLGLTAADLAPGKPIRATGAPRREQPDVYLLTAIILPSGKRYTFAE